MLNNNNTNYKKIDITIDEYFINPYKFNYKDYNPNNLIIDNDLNDLNSIIKTLTSIILNNSNNKQTNIDTNNIIKNDNFDSTLFKLVANNDLNQLESVIHSNPNININEQDKDGDTTLHIAIFLCNIKAIEILINSNAKINIKDKWGQIPLHRICFCMSDLNVIKIVNLFTKINNKNKSNKNNIFNIQDNYGNTPLHLVLKHIIKNNTIILDIHLKLIFKLKAITNNNIKNIDGHTISDFILLLKI